MVKKYRPLKLPDCSTAITSAGVSTTQMMEASRDSSEHIEHMGCMLKFLHCWQWPTSVMTRFSTPAKFWPPSRSRSSRCQTIRCADFLPTPGRHRSASTNSSSNRSDTDLGLEGKLEAGRHLQPAGQFRHSFLLLSLHSSNRIIHGGCQQVLKQGFVL